MLNDRTWMAAALALAVTAPTMADSIDMTWRGRGEGQMTRITHNGQSMRVFAGELRYQFTRGEGEARRHEGVHAVLRQSLADGPARSLLAHRPGGSRMQMGHERAPLDPGQRAAIGAALARADAGAASPAAAQLAIWEITHDFANLDIRTGSFSANVDEELLSQVEGLLLAARDDAPAPYTSFGSAERPTVLTTSSVVAPLPAPLALAGVGFALAFVASRRRARAEPPASMS
jgi:hypothetical protein